jgi:diketogulonate reductase-like aldo/keto reductase
MIGRIGLLRRQIPRTNEGLPVIGLGTWRTFDVGASDRERRPLVEVLHRFAAAGGNVIDSSPMYGRSEAVAGELRSNVPEAFLATKVWTRGRERGIEQMKRSLQLLGVDRIDLMQVHNLVDWRTHLETLREWKRRGRVRYYGVTHYRTGAFAQIESIMRGEEIDFVQIPLSITVPEAGRRLLPLAADRGIAVIVNRPFEGGAMFTKKPLPAWAADFGCRSWAEIFLRWIVAHPEVTCVIPATHDPIHMSEDLRAGEGRVLTVREREELRKLVGRGS